LKHKVNGRCHIFVSGTGKIGKTSVLKELANKSLESSADLGSSVGLESSDGLELPDGLESSDGLELFVLAIDMAKVISTPLLFAQNVCLQLLTQLSGSQSLDFSRSEDFFNMLKQASGRLQLLFAPLMKFFTKESRTKKIDYNALVEEVFALPQRISVAFSQRLTMVFDNFECILELSNYKELKHVLPTISKIMGEHQNVSYVISGNQGIINEKVVSKIRFFKDKFVEIPVRPLSRTDTYLMVSKIFADRGIRIPRSILTAVHRFSMAFPFYISIICERIIAISAKEDISLTPAVVAIAFSKETLLSSGRIYNECTNTFDRCILSTSGVNSLKAVLQILAGEEGLSLAEIGRRMNRSNGQVHGYLKSLLVVDLLFRKDKKYYFVDPVLRFFMSQTLHIPFFANMRDMDALRYGGNFIRDYLCNRKWLSYALYDEIEALALSFDGSVVKGTLFGSEKDVHLPSAIAVEPLVGVMRDTFNKTYDSKLVVSDLWIRGKRRHWMVEVSTGEDLFTVEDYEEVRRKRTFFERSGRIIFDYLWIVSRIGFTAAFVDEAKTAGVLYSLDEGDLKMFKDRAVYNVMAKAS